MDNIILLPMKRNIKKEENKMKPIIQKELYYRSWLLMFICFVAMTSTAQTVNISGNSPLVAYHGYPCFRVSAGSITVSSSEGQFDYVYIDNVQKAYNSSSYWSTYSIDISEYCDGKPHKLQLTNGTTNRGICYICSDILCDTVIDGIYYIGNNETATVVSIETDIENLTIPEICMIDGVSYPVTTIAPYAFYEKTNLKSITIPQSITTIGASAFNGCTSLKDIIISDSESSIELGYNTFSTGTGKGLFADCPLETLYIGRSYTIINYNSSYPYNSDPSRYGYSPFPSTVSTLTIGNGVTSIPDYFLYNGSQIENLTIPNSVTSIGMYAFRNSSKVKSVVIPEGVTRIGYSAFSDCYSLIKSAYPSSISNPFSYGVCISYPLSSIMDDYGVIYNSEKTQIYFAPLSLDSNYTIPNTVTTIGSSAFRDCSNIVSVVIPEGVTRIGESAFSNTGLTTLEFNATNCTTCGSSSNPAFPSSITSLTIGNGVTSIPDYFLYNGSQIENLTIPNSVTSIGRYAFWNSDSKLKSLTIGSGLLSIGDYSFSRTTGSYHQYTIPKVFWLGNTPPTDYTNIKAYVNYVANDQYSLSNQLKYQFLSSKFTVDGTTYIPVSPSERTCDVVDCVYSSEFEDIIIADKVSNRGVDMNVLNVNKYAFYNNGYLKSLNISNKGNIGSNAFYRCNNLQTVTLGNNVTGILSECFYGCFNLQTVTLGNNVTGILSECFYGCSAIRELTIPNSVVELGRSAFKNCSALERISIGTGVPSLPDYVFSGCSSLLSLTVPNNIASIGNYAFQGCSSLGDVTIEDAEQIEKEKRFPDWTSTNHSSYSTSAEEYVLNVNPGDVLTFNYTVSSAVSDYLTISLDGVDVIRESGAKSGSYRKVFETSKQVTLYMRYTKNSYQNAGSDNASVTDILLGTGYLVLGSNGSDPMFKDCPLDEVYIGRKLSYLTSSSYGYSPFYRNVNLRTVEITDAETQIYDNEFYGCSNLSSLTIGNGVKAIGNWAFSGCSSLDYFSAGYMVESIGKEAFSDCTGLTKYYSYSKVPPVCGDQALDDINKWDCMLYVPDESSDEYQAAPQWKDFFFIEEMDAVLVTELQLNMTEAELEEEESIQLTVEVLPSNATNKDVEWSSSDESVATVTESGLITAIATGTAVITVRSKDGNSEATCTIIVQSNSGVKTVLTDGSSPVEVYNLNGYKISDSTDNLAPGIYIVRQGAKTYKMSLK